MDSTEQCLLLVDDDDYERANITHLLQGAGFKVYQARDGQEGLAMLAEIQPAVVLCDLNTPNIDGPGLLQAIEAESADMPVIVISSVGVMDDVVEALRFGASDYLIKPIEDAEVLEHAIGRCIEQRNLRQENLDYREQLEEANQGLQQNLEVLEQDQQAGKQVQLKMLPPSPNSFGSYTFSHKIVPSLLLSGDFVEYFTVGDHYVVFFIADVSGHGASSAFVTVLLKNMFARKRSDFIHRADNTILSPVGMLDVANRNLLNTEIGKHATLCVGVINQQTDVLRYSVAGHLPLPLLATAEGCQYLHGEGMPVGLFSEAEYTEKSMELPECFVMTLFSDGILEVLPVDGLMAQEEYLLETLKSAPGTVEQLSELLELDKVVDAPDDIAMLLITKNSVS
jgi:serine phosphatase RsbU (regulator of sigma subunit)